MGLKYEALHENNMRTRRIYRAKKKSIDLSPQCVYINDVETSDTCENHQIYLESKHVLVTTESFDSLGHEKHY
ncbi:CLUMA_CG005870, isoform A [Clunio marinus]|uniref:CLUMA_CG005870, isoform A n=1 Tax=Clunio marinus TaxID=568069 RepID=A0A1J1HYA7_9DIPT|nr:CLUMA_CG005870, isoform A [Clunio marinus]